MRVQTHTLRAAQAGDERAMHELLRLLRPDIRRYAAYKCGRASAIDDVVQEVMIVVNRHVGTVRSLQSFPGWLARVITRICLLPALKLIQAAESLVSVEDSIDFSTRPDDELRLDVARAIESLPEPYRTVVLLRDFEELTIGEMAQRLSLTREATKSRLHRARASLREYLMAGGHGS